MVLGESRDMQKRGVSLGAPFVWPSATSKKKKLSKLLYKKSYLT